MKNNWFPEVFLPSLIEKAKQQPHPKYPNRVILSQKQYEVCYRNMAVKTCQGDYGQFYMLVFETSTHKFQAEQAGKYNFLYITEKTKG